MKKTLKIFGISILILILFRGFIYRLVINYSEIGSRTEIKITDQALINRIEKKSRNQEIGFEEIINIATELTNETLKFTIKRASNNPNELINSNQANCIGYSAMFNSIANFLIRKNNLEGQFEAKHKVGQLNFPGISLHQFFDNPFFKDHDFNDVINNKTGEIISIDPSLNDYLWISSVTKN